ncbi:MAG: response regulator [Thermosynechococcaceae cyanobacterium MS004]|nr:response regulator [Thermosynechococcaceae cyanobacterium MS004]
MIRILLVDDQKTIREALRLMLDSSPDFQVVGTASDGHTAIEQVGLLHPDVVLIDMEMPGLDGVSATRVISQRHTDVKVLVLSMHDDDEFISQSMQAGAMGYLLKNTPSQELRAAIRFVNRGYAQIGPGLLDKMVTADDRPVANGHLNGHAAAEPRLGNGLGSRLGNGRHQALDVQPQAVAEEAVASESSEPGTLIPSAQSGLRSEERTAALASPHYGAALNSSREEVAEEIEAQENHVRNRWKRYLLLGLALNAFLWMAALAAVRFKRPVYTSTWTLDLPASRSDTFLEVPGVGRAAETNVSPYSNIMVADPRANYKDLINTSEVLRAAAGIAKVPTNEFMAPRVEVVPNTTLIKLSANGKSPRDAYQKAIAVQTAFNQKVDALRQQELVQQNKTLKVALDASSDRLKQAQQRLSSYKVQSGLDSGDQLRDLSVNIEALRRQRAETAGQAEDSAKQLSQLSASLGLSPQQAGDAFVLQSDAIFQQYLLGYSKTSADLTTLESAYSSDHPTTVDKAEEKAAARAQLFKRGEQLLGHPMSEATLQQINVSNGISSDTQRSNLFQQLITLKGKEAGARGQMNALDSQIRQLEAQMTTMSKKKSILVNLERDVQIAEAIFTSTLGKLDLTKSSYSVAYPEVLLRTRPSIPRLPSSPRVVPILLGTFLSSVLVSAGLAALWLRDRRIQRQRLEKAMLALDTFPALPSAQQADPRLRLSGDRRMLQPLSGQE